MRRSVSLPFSLVVLFSIGGCGGLLVLDETSLNPNPPCTDWRDCPLGRVCEANECVEADPCSPANPDAPYCPEGRRCVGGVCVTDPTGNQSWCDSCSSTQGCLDGVCVEITVDNACSPTRLDGVCAGGEVCVGGECVPIVPDCNCDDPGFACREGQCVEIPTDQACAIDRLDGLCPDGQLCVAGVCVPMANNCSLERPWGLCPSGATCVNGFCLAIDERPCGPGATDGLCPAGQVCQAPGQCVPAPCSATHRAGVCEAGKLCVDGTCLPLPCGPTQHSGACPATQFCSASGACLPDGRCAVTEDCPAGNVYCSCEEICINRDTCLADCDCPEFFVCDALGTAACVRDYDCAEDVDCPAVEFCAESDNCLPDGSCEVDADCRSGTRFCSEIGSCSTVLSDPNVCLCLDVGQCRTDADCANVDPSFTCSSAGVCRPAGYCDGNADCPPGHTCDTLTTHACVKGPNLCTDNDFTAAGCSGDEQLCCASGTCCAVEGARCSTEDTCLDVGQCLTTDDCLGGVAGGLFTCSAEFRCTPVTDCGSGCNPVTDKCSAAIETCIPKEYCAGDADCAEGEYCHATFTCVPALNCGAAQTEVATLLKPNVMLVLDRSGSMQKCDASIDTAGCCGSLGCTGACSTTSLCNGAAGLTTRWSHALSAIDTITGTYDAALRFGLATYPLQWCGTPACGVDCNSCSCEARYCTMAGVCHPNCTDPGVTVEPNGRPGQVDVGIREFAYTPVREHLLVTYPGGATPTGPTLRAIRDNPYGATGAGFTTDGRENIVILITDGEANQDTATVGSCGADAACKVNSALNDLRALSSPINSYVVGFAFTGVNTKLNCHAVAGGRSLCPADHAYCAEFTSGGAAACASVSCAWTGVACAGDDTHCGRLTDDGEASCTAATACVWDVGSSTCRGDSSFCGTFTTGGQPACAAGGCYWSGTACEGVCWTFEAGGQTACEAVGCTWNGSCAGDDTACAALTVGGRGVCEAEPACRWDVGNSLCEGDDAHCATVAAGGQAGCEAGQCFWTGTNCAEVDATNCDAAVPACYYNATDAEALGAALDEIAAEVASCTFRLGTPPPDPNAMYVYLEYLNPGAVPADCSNEPYGFCRVPRDRSRTENWDYDPFNVQVEFYGTACNRVFSGQAVPLILFGCTGPGG